ncbi:MAG TPA: riboflavin synthase [Gemmatimonadales bacterium]|nr:riboflavin synthase [Gemmatimonadales bacterium]
MFTGVVTAVGRVTQTAREPANGRQPGGLDLAIHAPYRGLKRGESIAVNGACLTVARVTKGGFQVRAVETTVGRTLFGEYRRGRRVNLERAVRAADRLGGHLVQGHVDGIAQVVRVGSQGDARLVDLEVPSGVLAVSIPLGAITVDGVSLTVNALPGNAVLQVSLIPYTVEHTTLGELKVGDRVHVEGDVIGKYVRQLCRSET